MTNIRKPCSHGVSMDCDARCIRCEIVWWEGVFADAEASSMRAAKKLTALRAEIGQPLPPADATGGRSLQTIEEFVDSYEFRGESDHKPTEDEQALLLDALHGWEAERQSASPADAGQSAEVARVLEQFMRDIEDGLAWSSTDSKRLDLVRRLVRNFRTSLRVPPPQPGLEREFALALREATDIAVALHRDHFVHVPQWRPLEDLRGVISQIDNMVCAWLPTAEGG